MENDYRRLRKSESASENASNVHFYHLIQFEWNVELKTNCASRVKLDLEWALRLSDAILELDPVLFIYDTTDFLYVDLYQVTNRQANQRVIKQVIKEHSLANQSANLRPVDHMICASFAIEKHKHHITEKAQEIQNESKWTITTLKKAKIPHQTTSFEQKHEIKQRLNYNNRHREEKVKDLSLRSSGVTFIRLLTPSEIKDED